MNNYVLVKVIGKNINNYVKWLVKSRIDFVKLKIVKHNEIKIIVDYKYFEALAKYSKTYDVKIIKRYGYLRIIDILKCNKIMIFCFGLAILFVYFLSNYIFSIQIIYNDQEIVKLLEKELARYNIKRFKRKQDYEHLVSIKNNILANNKDVLEWLEIEEYGTRYVVRLVERKKAIQNNEYQYQSIIAKKDAVISSIKSYSGEKVKFLNDYVRRGDVIISGVLTKTNGETIYEKAKGIVLGEVWYHVQIDYPLFYQEEKLTGKAKEVINVYFLNKSWPTIPFRKYKYFDRTSKVLVQDNFIPLMVTKEKLYEVIINEEIYTSEQAIIKAKEEAIKKLRNGNKDIVSINGVQVLNKDINNSLLKLDLFISAIEDITEIIEVSKHPVKVEN